MVVTVNKSFRDVVEHVDRKEGDTFECTEERAKRIETLLPGYVTVKAEAEAKPKTKTRARAKSSE